MLSLHHSAGGSLGFYPVTQRTFVVQLANQSTNTGGSFVMPAKMNIMLQTNNLYCCCSGEGFFLNFVLIWGFLWSFADVTVDILVMMGVMFYLKCF